MDRSTAEWANEVLKTSLRSGERTLVISDAVSALADNPGREIPIDPKKLEYLRRLIAYILDGREIAATYNYVLLVALAVFTALHWWPRFRDARRRRTFAESHANTSAANLQKRSRLAGCLEYSRGDTCGEDVPSSSSSSTLAGAQSPGRPRKTTDIDLERQPLLGRDSTHAATTPISSLSRVVESWLMYQPRPIPVINRSLPSNGTSLVVLAYICVNIFFNFYQGSLKPEYSFAFTDRAGYVFIVNLPLLYLLAAKNQPFKFLTGYSYEALNIFHRRVGELMCFEAVVHFVGMLLWNLVFTPDWLRVGDLQYFMTRRLTLLGLGAFISYESLYFTSLGTFRQRWYELFLASHVFLQVAALVFLYLHFWTARPYVLASLAIFLADRIVWRLGLKSTSVCADLDILEDGNTLRLSADWDIPRSNRRVLCGFFRQNITHGWHPMDHVFITVESLGRTHALQAHPFTIASAAPGTESDPEGPPNHAWLSLLIRAHDGFTTDLLQHARFKSTVDVRIDGPYGSVDALEMLQIRDTAVLIAGGSGIAVVFPLLWALVHSEDYYSYGREIHLLWVIHSRSHRSWMPQERLDELEKAGVHITIPEPTAEAGRPNVDAYIEAQASQAREKGLEMGLVVSGPDNLNRTVRNASARAVGRGTDIQLRIEKFGW
ncbi:hypothetical protein JX266_010455 [Neoarthrinium moseri]|uniref:uncharacterized protein n=1 Tax=Neoarthrinium moseri TaxID=1658444 RepID=UPI001FDC0202|nr:uncharacterized protein JN550_003334 [Neoarthrinium moseri]KAI1843281.1 hypothetical protein JX266_010455 [Neoarthrinium moseri]KAI1873081.1 hypothetical protein JN550_003334 [Neoarthrinium moseri]